MALIWSYDAHTEIGLVRTTNQDSAYVSPDMLLVADGMGGAAAGDLASAVATWELQKTDSELAERLVAKGGGKGDAPDAAPAASLPGDDLLTVMAGALGRANARLVELVEDDPQLTGMGTTVCGFVLAGGRAAVVNIGDSRAYLIRDGRLRRVTRDHSWVQSLVDEGRISEEEALEHPHRSLVLKVLNGSPSHEPDLDWLDLRLGDRLLVCSDGLCGLVTDAQIAPLVTNGKPRPETIADLVELAHDAGGHDNITIVVADIVADGPPGETRVLGAAASTPNPSPEHTLSFPPLSTDDLPDDVARERAITEEERYALLGRRRRSTRVRVLLLFLIPVLALCGGAALWYQYTQTQYYIGPSDSRVALFRGVPDRLFGQTLSTLLETDETRIDDLPPYYREMVAATIRVESLDAGRSTLDELAQKASECVAQREARAQATATPTPAPTTDGGLAPVDGTAPPAEHEPLPGVTASVGATGDPGQGPVTSPEEC